MRFALSPYGAMATEFLAQLLPVTHVSPAIPSSCVAYFVFQKAGKLFGIFTAQDRFGRPVLLFRNEWKLANVQGDIPELELVPWSRPPDIE